jgi:ABC-2 type transport system permease protein
MDGEIWSGKFDFTLLRPVNVQFLASVRYWQPLALIDLVLALGVLATAVVQLQTTLTLARLAVFLITLGAGLVILYAILLAFSALVLWSPGFLFTWLFNAFFQMARYPVSLYPGWLRLILTWIVPVGVMTTVPAQALTGHLSATMLIGSIILASILFVGSSALFRIGLRRYASASS